MEKNKLLVVYNTCGFSGREPVDWYIDCIKNILAQDLEGTKVVLSSCGNSSDTIKKLVATFGRSIATISFMIGSLLIKALTTPWRNV